MDHKETPDHKVLRESKDQLVLRVPLGHKDPKEMTGNLVPRVILALMVAKVQQDQLVLRASPVHKDHLVLRGQPVHKVPQDRPEIREILELLE
jgi:hypothetical protein